MDQATSHSGPLKLFWWQATPNFGDDLSRVVVAHVSGRDVVHARPPHCDLVALGSLLHVVRNRCTAPRSDGSAPWIWGAGMLKPIAGTFLPHVQIAALRGPVSAAVLGLKMAVFGDPGLLAADAIGPVDQQEDRVGLVPHHSQMDDPRFAAMAAMEPALKLIDVRRDAVTVCQEIAQCRHVISASLHGLVVADAYGIPNTWLDPEAQGRFKYHDYAASLGRRLVTPVSVNDAAEVARQVKDTVLPYADAIAEAKATLTAHFPAPLRADFETNWSEYGL